jgi:hypothetical protein
LEPKNEPKGWTYPQDIVGIADYKNVNTGNLPVVIKLETGTTADYFIGFNRATGVNSQNDQASDKVTVIQVSGIFLCQVLPVCKTVLSLFCTK